MKRTGAALRVGLVTLIVVVLLSSARLTNRKSHHRKRSASILKAQSRNQEISLTFDTDSNWKLIDREKNHRAWRSVGRRTKKRSVRRRKSKSKRTKKKRKKTKNTALADEPNTDVAVDAAFPAEIKNVFRANVTTLQNLSGIPSGRSSDEILPGWFSRKPRQKCGKCVWQECPPIDAMRQHCSSGIVRDECSCCVQCANGVGMPCFLSAFPLVWSPACGDDLECVSVVEDGDLTLDSGSVLGGNVKSEGICSCKDRTPVCGSNNNTYDNHCELREASSRLQIHMNTTVTILHRGPCKTAPSIDSEPIDATGRAGNVVSFRCETSGFPLPRIQWFKRSEKGRKVKEEEVPGYLSHAVSQMRGGPGKYQLTTWLTLDKVKGSDSGTYVCRSSNDFGTVDGRATLSITDF